MSVDAPDFERLRSIKTLPSLIAYLRDELEWPIERNMIEDDITFDYSPEELGITPENAVGIKEIKQLRPMDAQQPWGIFWINFEKKRLPVAMLRRILGRMVIKKRASAVKATQRSWQANDLLFISAYGEEHVRAITFAHFVQDVSDDSDLPVLKVLGWDGGDAVMHLADAHHILAKWLRWPSEPGDPNAWRYQWSQAFPFRHREVVLTTQELVEKLAGLATSIRKTANTIISRESDRGPMRRLFAAFKTALIHDLSEDDFADVIAQTISYGLLAARFSSKGSISIKSLVEMIPPTNPFLRELLAELLAVAGRKKGAFDFDELGIQDVVDLLNQANTEAVKSDFGNKTRNEDPVIHFYEHFLKAYDKKKKVQRGVFFTPPPVVSYIVRSVHELLQTEFGLEDGLADTTTWGEMVKRSKDLKIPDGAKAGDPFVLILDPATGTATFLVEVIEVIFTHLKEKWTDLGKKPAEIFRLWNDYVQKNLLPRLYGYELMMAPYTIAHMKLALKLQEINARLGQPDFQFMYTDRAHIYLTNSLEPAGDDKQGVLEGIFPALAHEAAAVNRVKRDKRYTVVIGNPPYSKISSNLTPEMRATVERYRYLDGERIKERGALQFEINLQDDYVKFFRFCEERIGASHVGLMGLITNNGYVSTPTLRGMRDSLLETFCSMWILDLHGHLAKGERGPDGVEEQNVFDIVQGVGLFLGHRGLPKLGDGSVFHAELYGSRESKYSFLRANKRLSTTFSTLQPSGPFYLFIPHNADLEQEWKNYIGLADLFPKNSAGVITARDSLVLSESKSELAERLDRFSHAKGTDDAIYLMFGFSESKRFDLRVAQSELRKLKSYSAPIRQILHRPFDVRFIFFHPSVVWSLSRPMADQMIDGTNLALVATRQVTRPQFEHAYVSRHIIEFKVCSHDRNTHIFPLFLRASNDELALSSGVAPNLDHAAFTSLARPLALKVNTSTKDVGKNDELTPLRLFHYAYAVLHSPGYRERYFEFLRSDFPRLPLTSSLDLFRALAKLGGELVALHLMESPDLDKHITQWVGGNKPEVEKVSYSDETVWIDKAKTKGFQGVPENVWNFHIGGYQVCEKWLKDRGPKKGKPGRILKDEDINHYQKIVVALNETIRIMKEIDEVIDKHGGWPGEFVTD